MTVNFNNDYKNFIIFNYSNWQIKYIGNLLSTYLIIHYIVIKLHNYLENNLLT